MELGDIVEISSLGLQGRITGWDSRSQTKCAYVDQLIDGRTLIYRAENSIPVDNLKLVVSKKDLRYRVLEQRKTLPKDERQHLSSEIAEHFRQFFLGWTKPYLEAVQIGLYSPVKGEVLTQPIFNWAHKKGLVCAYPRSEGDRLKFYPINALEDLTKGSFGILEPPHSQSLMPPLLIVPGIAFDRSGNRIGFGHGYYDRTLIDFWLKYDIPWRSRPVIMGLAYSFQVFDHIPANSKDQKVTHIITEKGVEHVY